MSPRNTICSNRGSLYVMFGVVLIAAASAVSGIESKRPASTSSASLGCGKRLPARYRKGASITNFIKVDKNVRSFIISIPSRYQMGTPSPIVYSFHGRGKNSSNQQKLTGLSVEEPGKNPGNWIAVYPQGVKNAWEGAPYAETGVSDIKFFNELLDQLESTLCIDKSRVYATGKSNGGGFSALLACTTSTNKRIAAIAPVSAAFYEDIFRKCDPTKKITPIFDIHGTADRTIKFGGGTAHGENYTSIHAVYGDWAARQGCRSRKPTNDWKTNESHWFCDRTRSKEATITQLKVPGMGHWWPSPKPNSDNPAGGSIDGTKLVVEFLKKWTLPTSY